MLPDNGNAESGILFTGPVKNGDDGKHHDTRSGGNGDPGEAGRNLDLTLGSGATIVGGSNAETTGILSAAYGIFAQSIGDGGGHAGNVLFGSTDNFGSAIGLTSSKGHDSSGSGGDVSVTVATSPAAPSSAARGWRSTSSTTTARWTSATLATGPRPSSPATTAAVPARRWWSSWTPAAPMPGPSTHC